MGSVKDLEIWRHIPPEEKLDVMHRSHAKGVTTCILSIIVCGTLAISVQYPWLLWGSLIFTPFTFQFRCNLSWRSLQPSMVLKYLAARSVCRRYAYSAAHSKELELEIIFPAVIWKDPSVESQFTDEEKKSESEEDDIIQGALKSLGKSNISNDKIDVWVAMFKDAIVFVKESKQGGRLMFAAPINVKLKVHSISENESDYDPKKELVIEQQSAHRKTFWKMKSNFPASLIVFEKKLSAKIKEREELGEYT